MLNNLKYADNVIFQKGAVQELLTNIKNYPIIDIDFIEDNEVDDSNRNIWQTYTDGTPCIKITYGDNTTTKGNIIFASEYKKAKAKAEAKILSLGRQAQEEADTAEIWRKIYIKNNDIYQRRIGLLDRYVNAESLANQNKTKDFITAIEAIESLQNDYNGGFDYFWNTTAGYPAVAPSTLPGGVDPHLFRKEEIKIYKYQYLNVTENDLTEEERILKNYLSIIQNDHKESLLSRLMAHQSSFNGNSETDTAMRNSLQAIIDDLNNYPDYGEIIDSNNQNYLVANYTPSENSDATAVALWTYIYNFLNQVVNSAETKRNSAQTIYNYYKNKAATFNQQKTNLENIISTCNYCIELIADGTHDINPDSRNIKILKGNTNISGFGNSGNITITNLDDWINKAAENNQIRLNADVLPNDASDPAKYDLISVSGASSRKMVGHKYVKVGSNITFDHNLAATANYGTFVITINGEDTVVPIKGFQGSNTNYLITNTGVLPNASETLVLGSSNNVWKEGWINHLYTNSTTSNIGSSTTAYNTAYITNINATNIYASSSSNSAIGSAATPFAEGYFGQITIGTGANAVTIGGSGGSGDSGKFLRGDGTWSNTLTGALNISNTNDGIKQGASGSNGFNSSYTGTYVGDTTASIYTTGGIYAAKNIIATRVFNAVFNDYAECRQTTMAAPGYVVIDQDDGTMIPSSKRLQPGAQIISDTYGHLMGMTDNAKTPIAVSGRALVYTYRPREEYHAGMAVCSAPGGTIDIMTREEIKEYPDCIIGIVSEIPKYNTWGSDNIKINGRIWVKVR